MDKRKTGASGGTNSDQGSHFTSPKYTELFLEAGARISMDHCARVYDNIFVERLWRTVSGRTRRFMPKYSASLPTKKDAGKSYQLLGMDAPARLSAEVIAENAPRLRRMPGGV